ncbi:MAG: hypothetical protein AAF741_03505 [Bacteroidota bacterium]
MIKFLKSLFIFSLLTLITQVVGIIYLIYKPLGILIKKRVINRWKRYLLKSAAFSALMILFSLFIIPPIARTFGRVPLPLAASEEVPLQPANIFLAICNRHYVKPALKELSIEVSQELARKYPGTILNYLDANFPFFDGFPLLPHRSHDDGEKLDFGFLYQDPKTGKRINASPTLFGYGYSEGPAPGEYDQIKACTNKGYWQYDLLSKLASDKSDRYQFDIEANRALINLLIAHPETKKIFIEPHLKTRLGFSNAGKVRFHGCKAVRHDDHIHIEIK